MAFVGTFQLVKYIRKVYPRVHRWVGRFYILASMIASVGGLLFIVCKGSFGGRKADVAFGAYGLVFLISGVMTYYYAAIVKDFTRHKLWAWRLYLLSLSAWLYLFDYYWWMLLFGYTDTPLGRLDGGWLYNSDMKGVFDYVVNWAFYVHLLLIVEIIFRWGENNILPTKWQRCLNVTYYVCLVMTVTFLIHQFLQLLVPSVFGGYNWKTQWILWDELCIMYYVQINFCFWCPSPFSILRHKRTKAAGMKDIFSNLVFLLVADRNKRMKVEAMKYDHDKPKKDPHRITLINPLLI